MTWHGNRRQVLASMIGAGLAASMGRGVVTAQAVPAATPAQSGQAAGSPRMENLLALAPTELLPTNGLTWASPAAAVRAANLPPWTDGTAQQDAYVAALRPLMLPSILADGANRPEFAPAFGFSPFQLTQAVYLGVSDACLTLVQGPFAAADLTRAWQASKYQPKQTAHGTVWSSLNGIHGDGDVDPSSPVFLIGMGEMDNAAILAPGLVAFTPTIELADQALAMAAKTPIASLADDERLVGVVETTPGSLVSAIALPGSALRFHALDDHLLNGSNPNLPPAVADNIKRLQREQEEERRAVGAMPQPSYAVFGGTSDGRLVMHLAVADRAAADRAATVMRYRWEHGHSLSTGKTWRELVRLTRAEGRSSPPVATIEFAPQSGTNAHFWLDTFYSRDLGLIGW